MAVSVDVAVNGSTDVSARCVTWSPAPCSFRLGGDAAARVAVVVTGPAGPGGRQLQFWSRRAGPPAAQLELQLVPGGAPVKCFVAGAFSTTAVASGDAVIQVRSKADNQVLASVPVNVRIRKDANTLSTGERDRFLSAFARLNNAGRGVFQSFREAHSDATAREAHFGAAFLPWHRAFLLDLERELQRLDPTVTLPYWRFDRPAPRVFRSDFMGIPDATGVVTFTPANPLRTWSVDGRPGIVRGPFFNTQTSAARSDTGSPVLAEAAISAHTGTQAQLPGLIESNPHGRAHVSFRGYIHDIETAARDPLFYMLHCNVDRLWAKWQWIRDRYDTASPATFPFLGNAMQPNSTTVGHNLLDTMWPWNNVTSPPRPNIAPRQPFPDSPVTAAPGKKPNVGTMIDYQGRADPRRQLGFDYDDVPYERVP